VGTSAGFDPPTLGLGKESVAQGCKNLSPVAVLKESLSWAWAQARLHPFIWQFESDLMCFLNAIYSSEKENIFIKCSGFMF
jgi:hypothetical protein